MLVGDPADGLQVSLLRKVAVGRLHHDGGEIMGMLVGERLQRRDVVEREELLRVAGEAGHHAREWAHVGGEPVMVPVEAMAQNEVPARRGSRDPRGGRAGIGAVLAEDHPLGAGEQRRQQLRDLDLVAMEQ